MPDLKMVDITPTGFNEEIGTGNGGRAMTTNIKIRFKKGAVFFVAGGSRPGGGSKAATKLAIRLSPGGGSKRKAVEEVEDEIYEHALKHVKTGAAALDSVAESSESVAQATNNRAASPAYSTGSNTTATIQAATPPKKGPIQAASIYRKLARKLADQPLLLEDFKAYRTALTLQRRNDIKNIASLRSALSAATKDTTRKDERVAEDLRAMQDMVEFWTDACNAEFERTELIKGRMRGFVDDIETLMKAEAASEASAGFEKDRQIKLELQKIVAQMNDVVGGVGLENGKHRMEDLTDNLEI